MKKLKILMSILLATTLVHITSVDKGIEAHAEDNYPMACENYEVAYVTDEGTFSKISCHQNFDEAKEKMYASGNDAVVRHHSSKSPTKIIAMSSGIAASYAYRRGYNNGNERKADSTMNITQYEYPTRNEKITYVTSHREMNYKGTYSYNPSDGTGRIGVNLTGFDGYANLDQVDLIPMKIFQNGLRIQLGGNNDGSPWEAPFWVRPRQSYYEVIQNGNYKDIVFHAWSYWASQDIPQDYSTVIGPAEAWMKTGDIYYTNNMHSLYSDRYFQNPVVNEGEPALYYNYYQFLPMRSRTQINGDQLNAYLNSKGYTEEAYSYFDLKSNQSKMVNSGWYFVNAQETYGVNALMTFSMGLLESGWGRSHIAITKNNLFGWNAVDSSPGISADAYPSIEQAVTQHMAINLRGYLDINDARFFGMHLGNKGSGFNVKYASDPYWGLKIAGIAYDIDKFVSGYNGSLTEYGRYDLGVITEYGAQVKRSPENGSATMFTTQYGATYQNDFTIILQQQINGWSQFPTPNGVRADGSLVPHKGNGYEAYDWNNSVGYLANDKIKALHGAEIDNSHIGKEPTGEHVAQIKEMVWNENALQISGQSYRPGIYVTESNPATQKLYVVNSFFDKTEIGVSSQVNQQDQILFDAKIENLSEYADGSYYFEIHTQYAEFPEYNHQFIINTLEKLPEEKIIDKRKISFAVEDGILFMDISTVTPEVTPTPSPEVTPTPEPTPEVTPTPEPTPAPEIAKTVRQGVSKMEYLNDKENVLLIEGFAFINGYDFKEETAVTHQINLRNMQSGKVTEIKAETTVANTPINLYDGYEYSKINYSAKVDLDKLEPGSYTVSMKVGVGDVSKEQIILEYNESLCPKLRKTKDHQIRITQNQLFGYRYEINIEKENIDYSLISKPTRRNSAFDYTSFTLDQGKLNLDAMAWIFNVQFKESSKVSQNLIAMDGQGKAYPLESKNKACKVDYAESIGSEYSLKKACFDSSADLTQLPEGTYQLYADVQSDNYRDIYELTDIYNRKIDPVTYKGRNYEIQVSPVRYRLELIISKN